MTQTRRPGLAYAPPLDGIRAVAILAVMGFHARIPYFNGGFLGVDVFFVLSGFLITRLLLEEFSAHDRIDIPAFYVRRACRLLPALALLIVVLMGWVIVFPWASEAKATLSGMPYVIAYVGNWVRATGGDLGALGHTWSLAIEEQFYLAWPFLIALALRSGMSRVRLGLSIGLAAAGVVVWRSFQFDIQPFTRIYNGTDTRADPLFVGALVAFLPVVDLRAVFARRSFQLVAWLCALGCGMLVVFSGFRSPMTYRTSIPLLSVFVAVMIVAVLAAPQGRLAALLGQRWAAFTGRISYGLYLWNTPIVIMFKGLNLPLPVSVVGIIATTYAAAALSWFILERRIIPLGKHFTASRIARLRKPAPAFADTAL